MTDSPLPHPVPDPLPVPQTAPRRPRQSAPFPHRPFETFVAPARAHPQLWRLALGLVVALATYAAIMGAAVGVLFLTVTRDRLPGLAEEIGLGLSPWGMVVLLASFAALVAGTMLAARLVHGRRPGTLFGPAARVLRQFVQGAAVVAAVYGTTNLIFALLPGEPTEPNLPLDTWLWMLPLALIGVAIQTGAEELLFRGYLLQQLAARWRSRLAWMVAPSLLFGFLHFEPELMGPNAGYVVAATAMFGLVAADLTARSGALGLAWGLHFANNVAALLFVNAGPAMGGLALRRLPADLAGPEGVGMLILDMALIGVVWGLCRRILRR